MVKNGYYSIYSNLEFDDNFDNESNIKIYKTTYDNNVRDELMLNNMRLVFNLALEITNTTKIDIDDLIQVGVIAIIDAIDTYKLSENVKFSTYLYTCVHGQMFSYVDKFLSKSTRYYGSILRHFITTGRRMYGFNVDISKEPYFTEITNELIKDNIIKKCNIIAIKELYFTSLEENKSLYENVKYIDENDENIKIIEFMKDNYDYLTSSLTKEQKEIVEYKLGFKYGYTMTFKEIGELYNKTGEAIRQNYEKSINSITRKYKSIS
jgi:RNA polymerase sigma factor (sigma-70 family)